MKELQCKQILNVEINSGKRKTFPLPLKTDWRNDLLRAKELICVQ